MISGDLLPLRGTFTTIGAGVRGALVLGALLLLRARDGATDILLGRVLLRLGMKLEEALDGDEGR